MIQRSSSRSALVIGGGVIGLSTAWELSRRQFRVVVVERDQFGRGQSGSSSWAGAGILPPPATVNSDDPLDSLRLLSHRLHQQWSAELRDVTGIDNGYRKCGGIYLARSPGERATLVANEFGWRDQGIEFSRLSPQELQQIAPAIAAKQTALEAWHLPDECQIRNPDHLRALYTACQKNGVTFLPGSAVEDIEIRNQRVESVMLANAERLVADEYVICAGAWTRQFLDQLSLASGILPVRGQIVLYQLPQQPFACVVNEGHRYLVPREDGYLLAGSVEEEVGYKNETTREAINSIQRWAEAVMPDLSQHAPVKTWAGLRPGSYDAWPYIGRAPSVGNLFLAAGHFRSGLHLSCGTAVCLAELIQVGTSPIDLWPFRVGRG